MDLGLKGKRVLVTGGSRGIGAEICRTLAAEGAHIATCARRVGALGQTLAELRDMGVQAVGDALDVRDEAAFAAWIDQSAEALGGLDIVVSNVSTRVDPTDPEWWRGTFEADLMQHIRVKTCASRYLERGDAPAMVFVSSIASVMTRLPPHEEAYGAMKAALVNLVGQWAVHLAPKGIRVNAVSPGPIDFEGGWWDTVKAKSPANYAHAAGLAAMGRLGRPEEVACAVAFLASPLSSFTTGANLRIDGGLVATANF